MSIEEEHVRMLPMPILPMVVDPVTLDGQFIRLEPLSIDHVTGLCDALLDDDLWRWIFIPVKTPLGMQQFIETAMNQCAEGRIVPFAVVHKSMNRVIATTRYLAIDKVHHHLDIGTTVIAKQWQRTVVNTEMKFLMLRYAFETLGCLRVEFQTDSLNVQSRNALLRLGATQEGVLRNDKICLDGRVRHSVYFSITDEDWPRVKANLVDKLALPYLPKS